MKNRSAIMGIDPGVLGSIIVLDVTDRSVRRHTMIPTDRYVTRKGSKKRTVAIDQVLAIMKSMKEEHGVSVAVIEDVHSSPNMGVVSAFSFGMTLGILKAAASSEIGTVRMVSPMEWKARFDLKGKPKENAIQIAATFFPEVVDYGLGNKAISLAESTLIAAYCL